LELLSLAPVGKPGSAVVKADERAKQAMTQIFLPESANAENAESDDRRQDNTRQIATDIAYRQIAIVNVVFAGAPAAGDGNWVLIDAGVPGSAGAIRSAVQARFGQNGRPGAILMTHGHFDHVGSLERLAAEWDVPVYAHSLEHPYLNGTASYPPPDPSVGGGLMSRLSPLYPTRPVNVGARLRALPDDHSVPCMPGWKWLHTPGHSPGHVSFWREADRFLIAGDAFVTTKQESVYSAVTQAPEMHGPPMYFTPDWASARTSVEALAALSPETVVTGHGQAMQGPQMRAALNELAARFVEVAVPKHGKYVLS
jgi:glyoxylase-like metal-dependent hydrolase (beta-lactamase superfamily II)